MEIIQLEAFERAAREGSFTRAAETLGLTQPAVSQRITALEAELKGKLFERRGRTLKLTPLGERFLPYARRMLAVMADAAQAAHDLNAGKIGQVRIAAPTPFLLGLLVDALANFRYQHPQVDVWMRERDKKTILQMLYDNTMMIGLVNAPVYDGQFQQLARFRDPIRAIVSADHPLAERTTLRMEDIYTYTIFRVSMFPQMTAFIDTVVEHGRQGSGGAVIAVPMVMALRLVTQGEGVGFLPENTIRTSPALDKLVMLEIEDMPPLMSEPVMIAHKARDLDDVHKEFVRIFTATWRTLQVE